MTRAEKHEYWSERVAAFRDSGLSLPEWCSQNRTSPATLKYWVRKLTIVESRHNWMPVIVNDGDSVNPNLTIKVSNLTIEVHHDTDMMLLCDVVRALKAVC